MICFTNINKEDKYNARDHVCCGWNHGFVSADGT